MNYWCPMPESAHCGLGHWEPVPNDTTKSELRPQDLRACVLALLHPPYSQTNAARSTMTPSKPTNVPRVSGGYEYEYARE